MFLATSSRYMFRTFQSTPLCLARTQMFSYPSIMLSKLLSFTTGHSTISPIPPKILPQDTPIEEERVPGYDPKYFYHANPGEVLDDRFELKAKLGFGTTATVWLAQDIRYPSSPEPYVAIKITDSRAYDGGYSRHELDILNAINLASSSDQRQTYIRTALKSFEIPGQSGSHLCLVFPPMREPIWLLRRRLGADSVSRNHLPIFKCYIICILAALQELHQKCRIIHTDLKMDNILFTFEDRVVIDEFIQGQAQHPMPRKVLEDRTVYLSHNDFGPLRDINGIPARKRIIPKITDFGLAQKGDGNSILLHPIQPDGYQAPEVLLGTGWSYSADIWNLGVLIWDLLAGVQLFQRCESEDGAYSSRHHLAEMIALLGPVPAELVQRERNMRHWKWSPGCLNYEGKISYDAASFFGGPFFDDDGRFVSSSLISLDRSLRSAIPECLPEAEKDLFLDFIKRMLCWLPEGRATAEELAAHPWLEF